MTNPAPIIDAFTRHLGHLTRWLALVMVVITCIVVMLRYGAELPWIAAINKNGISLVALQEMVQYCHGALFMLGAAYTWQEDGHVRVDVFYRNRPAHKKNRINRFGIVLLVIPTCLFMFISSWEFVLNSWHVRETSQEAGGLAFVYVFKSLLLITPVLLIVQAIAELFKTFQPATPSDEVAPK